MTSCWMFHVWSKWGLVREGTIERTDADDARSRRVGFFLVQQRTCARCGLIQQKTTDTKIRDAG